MRLALTHRRRKQAIESQTHANESAPGSRRVAASRLPAPPRLTEGMIRTDHAADDGGSPEGATPEHGPCDGRPAQSADPEARPYVIIAARDFRLPEVLRHIEAGRIVRVELGISAPAPAGDADSPNPGTRAKPKKDRS
jgi:hypothetical protein